MLIEYYNIHVFTSRRKKMGWNSLLIGCEESGGSKQTGGMEGWVTRGLALIKNHTCFKCLTTLKSLALINALHFYVGLYSPTFYHRRELMLYLLFFRWWHDWQSGQRNHGMFRTEAMLSRTVEKLCRRVSPKIRSCRPPISIQEGAGACGAVRWLAVRMHII